MGCFPHHLLTFFISIIASHKALAFISILSNLWAIQIKERFFFQIKNNISCKSLLSHEKVSLLLAFNQASSITKTPGV
jgi:hypothetical protein